MPLTESSAHAMSAHPAVNGRTTPNIVYLRPILSIRYPTGTTATAAPRAIKAPTHAQESGPSFPSRTPCVGDVHDRTLPSPNPPNVTETQTALNYYLWKEAGSL